MVIVGIFLALFLGMTLLNLVFAVRLSRFKTQPSITTPLSVSFLIPVRNEKENLKRLIPSILKSESQPREILIFDDQSTDGSVELLHELLSKSLTPYKIIQEPVWNAASPLNGKNHGLQVLADHATSETLLFCDADVMLSQHAIGRSLLALEHFKSSGVTALPKQQSQNKAERLVLAWVLQASIIWTLPLRFAWRWRVSSLQLGNGQWILIRRDCYFKIGGHRAIGSQVLEDMTIARSLVDCGLPGLLPVLADQDLTVTMYQDWQSLVDGLSKNLILLFGGKWSVFLMIFLVFNVVALSPVWLMPINTMGSLWALGVLVLIRNISSFLFGNKMGFLADYFLSLYYLNKLVLTLMRRRLRGEVPHWKGRAV